MAEYDKGNGQRLPVGYTGERARKEAYNRDKSIRRLEKAYKRWTPTKASINKHGYNKFLSMEGDVRVTINYEKLEKDARGRPEGLSYKHRHTFGTGVCRIS